MIAGTGWRLVATIYILNCLHMQIVLQVAQTIKKTALLQQKQIAVLLLDRMQLLKQLQTAS